MQAIIDGNSLRLDNSEGVIAVNAVKNPAGKWRWYSTLANRYGRTHAFGTAELALRAGAKTIGIVVMTEPAVSEQSLAGARE